jgi:sugar O-acyltransferase (sialic acid O-acetyltransferase NeuD family)
VTLDIHSGQSYSPVLRNLYLFENTHPKISLYYGNNEITSMKKEIYKEIYIVGAGGHTRSIINVLEYNKFYILGIYDDSYNCIRNETINGHKLVGKINDIVENINIVLSIGDNRKREKYFKKYQHQIVKANLIHPKAYIDKNVAIGDFNQILANVYVNSNTQIRNNNILNTGCIIEHECIIGSHNHISVGSIMCGRVTIEDRCFFGAGSVVIDKLKICSDVIVGANAVVVKDINEPGTYVGNPAKKIK